MLPIVDIEPNIAYTKALRSHFDKLNLTVIPVTITKAQGS
jgi:hypothetical protein